MLVYYNFYYYVTYWLSTKGYTDSIEYFTFDVVNYEIIWHSWLPPIDKPTIEELSAIPISTIIEHFPSDRISQSHST